MPEYIYYVSISPVVEFKLRQKHNLTGDLVREAITYPAPTKQIWQYHKSYGMRLKVLGVLQDGRQIVAYLHKNRYDKNIWNLATAYTIERKIR